jgi:hypothetical protein
VTYTDQLGSTQIYGIDASCCRRNIVVWSEFRTSDGIDEDEEVGDSISQILSHPFPNPIILNDEEAQRTSPF